MEIFFGLISAAMVAYSESAFAAVNDGYLVHSFTCFVVIPLAAIFLGAVASSGVPAYLLAASRPVTCRSTLAACLCATIAFLGSYYTLYRSTYVNAGEVNFEHRGSHISEFTLPGSSARATFPRYLAQTVSSSSSTFYYRGRQLGSISSPAWSWIRFGMIGIGYALGGLATTGLLADRGYCDACRKYRTRMSLPSLDLAAWIQSRHEILEPSSQPANWSAHTTSPGGPELKARLSYCPSCNNGSLKVTPRVKTEKGYKDLENQTETIDVPREFVMSWHSP